MTSSHHSFQPSFPSNCSDLGRQPVHHYHHSPSKNNSLTRQSHVSTLTSFAQSLKEDDERFYETFPNAKAAKDAAHAAQLAPLSPHYDQHWSSHRLGEDYGVFQGNFVFYHHHEDGPTSARPSESYYLEQATSHPEPHPYIDPAKSPQPLYSHSFSHQVYDSPQPDVVNHHAAESLYAVGESVPYTDVNHGQDYAPLPVELYGDNSSQRHNVLSSPLQANSPLQSQAREEQENIQYNESLQPAVHAVEPPLLDYLPSPESPDRTDTVIAHHFFPADPAAGNELVSIVHSQPIMDSSPIPQRMFFKAEISHVPVDSPSPTTSNSFTQILAPRKRRRTNSDNQQPPPAEAGRSYVYKIPLPKPNHVPTPKVPKRRPSTPQSNEKKNLALACFFCRGRKIACGPHDPTSSDRTCGQCHRRALKCEYPTESRRGMRKKRTSVAELPPGSTGDQQQRQQNLGTLGS